METLEQLEEIIKNAPENATHFDGAYYIEHFCEGAIATYLKSHNIWHKHTSPNRVTRSLSDIKLIIELMEYSMRLETKLGIE